MRTYPNAASALNRMLEERGCSAAALARETGIDAGILRDILHGRRKTISTRNVIALSRYFGLSIRDFVEIMG